MEAMPEAETTTYIPETEAPVSRPGQARPQFINTSGTASSTPSIKDALSALKTPKPLETEELSGEVPEELSEEGVWNDEEVNDSETLLEEDLQGTWDKYVLRLKSDSPRMYLALSSQAPELQADEKTIRVPFRNSALQAEFKQNFKIPLLAYLRQMLHHNSLEIEEYVLDIEKNSQSKYYTDIDKLKYMIEKNPALQKLRQDFNLDFE